VWAKHRPLLRGVRHKTRAACSAACGGQGRGCSTRAPQRGRVSPGGRTRTRVGLAGGAAGARVDGAPRNAAAAVRVAARIDGGEVEGRHGRDEDGVEVPAARSVSSRQGGGGWGWGAHSYMAGTLSTPESISPPFLRTPSAPSSPESGLMDESSLQAHLPPYSSSCSTVARTSCTVVSVFSITLPRRKGPNQRNANAKEYARGDESFFTSR
jgi:hypothetical protein